MPVERLWRWTCSHCKLTVDRLDPGLPIGWIYLPRTITRVRTEHYCEECKAVIPAKEHRHPQIVAER